MTDLLDSDLETSSPGDAPESSVPNPKQCATPGCSQLIEWTPGRGRPPKNCPEHMAKPRERKAPASVTVQLGSARAARVTKAEKELAEVEARALQLMQVAAALVLIMGWERDAVVMQRGAKQWAEAFKGVAAYEPWMRKIAAGGEASGRVIAWIQLGVATGAIVVPILVNHNAVPPKVGEFLGMATEMAEQMKAQQAAEEQAAAEDQAEPVVEPEPAVA